MHLICPLTPSLLALTHFHGPVTPTSLGLFPFSITHSEPKSTFGCSDLILSISLGHENISYWTFLVILSLKKLTQSWTLEMRLSCSCVAGAQVKHGFGWLSTLLPTPRLLRENLTAVSIEKMFVRSPGKQHIFHVSSHKSAAGGWAGVSTASVCARSAPDNFYSSKPWGVEGPL